MIYTCTWTRAVNLNFLSYAHIINYWPNQRIHNDSVILFCIGTHRGWIPNDKHGTEAILPFEFDEARTAADRFRIANSLWSMIDGKQPDDVGAAPHSTCSYLR